MAKTQPPKKAVPAKAAPGKKGAKKKAVKANTKNIEVFSKAFTSMVEKAEMELQPELIVECNVDGDLRDDEGNILTFTSLDNANQFATAHRAATGHRCIVKARQNG